LGWAIYTAIAALVLGLPPFFGGSTYWRNARVYWSILAFSVAGTAVIIILIHLGMWAGDLVSGK
jgi:hypothetical protein